MMSDRICSTFEAGYWSRIMLTCEALARLWLLQRRRIYDFF
jgi:hypothetical protein